MMHTFAGRLCGMHLVAYIFVLVGALNWGLVALGGYIGANLNVVNLIFGGVPALERIIYLIVGISALVMLFQRGCEYCNEPMYTKPAPNPKPNTQV